MIEHELLHEEGILIVTPKEVLEAEDFKALAEKIDPYIEEKGKLNGLMIYVDSFPGWHDFGAFLSHFKFVKDHHLKIKRVAAVTDSGFLSAMQAVAKHFVEADIAHFPFAEKEKALSWLKETQSTEPQ